MLSITGTYAQYWLLNYTFHKSSVVSVGKFRQLKLKCRLSKAICHIPFRFLSWRELPKWIFRRSANYTRTKMYLSVAQFTSWYNWRKLLSPVSDVARGWGKAVTHPICRIFTEYDKCRRRKYTDHFYKKKHLEEWQFWIEHGRNSNVDKKLLKNMLFISVEICI